jgi:hypothetical protein
MKLPTYKHLLSMAKEKIQETLAPIRAHEMRKKAELEMAQIEGRLVEMQSQIQELCSAYPIDFSRLIDLMDEEALMQRRKKQFQTICEEMFPVEAA